MTPRTAKDIWETALGQLQLQVSKSNYRTWLLKTTGLSYQDNDFTIGVPNAFVAEYLEAHQRSLIEKTLIGLAGPDIRITFQVNGRAPDRSRRPVSGALPLLNSNYLFESFVEGQCNRLALAAALSVAQNPGKVYNPLFIHGGVGLGKSHLLHAIGHAALACNVPVVYATAEQFTNEYLGAIRERQTPEFRHKYRDAGMLLIDDIQFIGGKEQTEEGFFHTFNALHSAGRQVVVTSDRPPHTAGLEERLRSRFQWGLTVDMTAPDQTTRMAILEAKARQKGATLSADTIEYIAGQIQRNIRQLEGSLNRVLAYSGLLKETPSVELAVKALENLATKGQESPCTQEAILNAVATGFSVSPEDIRGRNRDKEITLARRVTMYLLRQETGHSLAQIGSQLGGRDASAVTVASSKVSTEIENSTYLKRKVQEITHNLRKTRQSP